MNEERRKKLVKMGGTGKEARKVGFETGSGPFHRESRVATGERAGLDPRRFPG